MSLSDNPPTIMRRPWFILGALLLLYAFLGNYLVLPGYRRFLENGSPNAQSAGVDYALIWGATKTILWLLSFHLGTSMIAMVALARRGVSKRFFVGSGIGIVTWLVIWSLPDLPGPHVLIFAGVGLVILLLIIAVFVQSSKPDYTPTARADDWRILGYLFFAFASWDVCGLGSVGGILAPESTQRIANADLVGTQVTKLIFEFAIAWGLVLISLRSRRTTA